MQLNMERWYNAVSQRFSVRRYSAPPGADEMDALAAAAAMLRVKSARIELVKSPAIFAPAFLGYGRIKGTDCFAALISDSAEDETIGYIGETLILEATALGIGSCWMGMFNKKAALEAVGLLKNESIRCIIALGMPGETYKGRPRKTLDELTGMDNAELMELPEWQQRALECARLAPSAMNSQPWRFWPDEEGIAVRRVGANYGFSNVDRGIAMLHIELGAAHCSVFGEWETAGAERRFRVSSGADDRN